MITKEKLDKAVENIKAIAEIYLKGNGGMDNGYLTYIEGRVKRHSYDPLIVETPKCGSMTRDQIGELGAGLTEFCCKYLDGNGIPPAYNFTFKKRYLGDGLYETDLLVTMNLDVVSISPRNV